MQVWGMFLEEKGDAYFSGLGLGPSKLLKICLTCQNKMSQDFEFSLTHFPM